MTQAIDPTHAELTIPSEMALRYAGATMLEPVFVLEPDTRIRYANPAAARLLGQQAEILELQVLADTAASLLATEVANRAHILLTTGNDTSFEATFMSRTWLCHVVPLRDRSGVCCALAVLCHNVSHIHEHAQRQLAAQQELTQVLVNEVRHRVKNNLQGIVGLLRQHQSLNPEATPALNNAITQLLAIGAVFGLEARVSENHIYLCSVVTEVVRALRGTYQVLHLQAPPIDRRATLADEYAVPIALVVNELITNAIKHTPQQPDADIAVTLEFTPQLARLRILNSPARLPDVLEDAPYEVAGGGLKLARALLPIGHASLSLANEGVGVVTVLTLLPPVVTLNA